jgi:hypothetical protein
VLTLRDDYSGPFDPDLTLADFSRSALVRLGYEYLLIGHLLDRCGQPLVGMEHGADGFVRSGIEEWMGASPIYSKRMQRFLRFEGDTVETVFKGIQFEVGSPQQFMDFQFRLDSPEYGEFWLCHCGALLDIEKTGNQQTVKLMCHDIEDPTFDATAAATNPRMVMRPIHRPPRIDDDVLGVVGNGTGRYPHCRWAVSISDENQPFEHHPNLAVIGDRKLATVDLVLPDDDAEPGGWSDYAHPFDPHATLQDFSHRALVGMGQEFCVQTLLLMQSFLLCNSQALGEEKGIRMGDRMWVGHARTAVERLQHYAGLGLEGDDLETMAKVLQLHPHFQPRSYVDVRVALTDADTIRLEIHDCPALQEDTELSWFRQLGREPHPALEAMVQHVNPRARVRTTDPGEAELAWEIVIEADADPAPEPPELAIARFTGGFTFRFEARRGLRV